MRRSRLLSSVDLTGRFTIRNKKTRHPLMLGIDFKTSAGCRCAAQVGFTAGRVGLN